MRQNPAMKSLKLKTKLIAAFAFFGLAPALIIASISWINARSSLVKQAEKRMVLLRETKTRQIEELVTTMGKQAVTMAQARSTVEALKGFASGFRSYVSDFQGKPSLPEVKKAVLGYYQNDFANEFRNKNKGRDAKHLSEYLDKLSLNGLALQYNYISANSNPLGSKNKLDLAADGTAWSRLHGEHHPYFRNYIDQFGYYDLFLVDGESGDVVYTVFKELDFATSLKTGPYATSSIGRVFAEVMSDEGSDKPFVLSDIQEYFPSYEAPAAFLGAPVFDGNRKIGVLIFQVPVPKISAILTNEQKWTEAGFGDSGEAFIVGHDGRLRSDSRLLKEQPEAYMNFLRSAGVSDERLGYVQNQNTSALTQEARIQGANLALEGKKGFFQGPDYRGVEVFAAYGPLEVAGLKWAIIAKVDTAEALDTVTLGRIMTLVLLASCFVILVFAVWFSASLTRKISHPIEQLKSAARGTLADSQGLHEASQRVSSAATQQASAIQETVATLDEITAMVRRSSDYARESSHKASQTYDVACEGKNAIGDMRKAMDEINLSNQSVGRAVSESNSKIGEIVKVINEISVKTKVINDIVFQTKLLSFNAAVEAARAGEHGQGFAVVAEEVNNLAQMSGTAAKEIEEMLSRSTESVERVVSQTTQSVGQLMDQARHKVDQGLQIARRCGEVFDAVVGNVEKVKTMTEDIALSSNEQSEGVNNIAKAMNQLDEVTHENSSMARQTQSLSERLSSQASSLETIVERLEHEVTGGEPKSPPTPALEDAFAPTEIEVERTESNFKKAA